MRNACRRPSAAELTLAGLPSMRYYGLRPHATSRLKSLSPKIRIA